MILKWNYDTSIVSVLPEGEVPYNDFDDQNNNVMTLSGRITDEVRRMHETGSFSLLSCVAVSFWGFCINPFMIKKSFLKLLKRSLKFFRMSVRSVLIP